MKKIRNLCRNIKSFLRLIIKKIDRYIVVPVTKFLLLITDKLGKNGKSFERWLTRKNTLVFLSLLLAIGFFFIVDNKSFTLVESSAEVLYNQPVDAIYNEEAYVVEGLPETVDVVLIGRRADLFLAKQLSKKNVNVDLSGLGGGSHTINLKYQNDVSTIDYKIDPSTANIVIYPKLSESRTVTVDVINQDKLDTKLSINNVSIEKKEIIIKGAEHILKKVSTVKALVDIKNLSNPEVGVSTLADVNLIAYDEYGQVINVEMVPNKTSANVSIIAPNKEVPIKVIPTGDVQFGKAISSLTSSVSKVVVYGEEAVINDIQYVPVYIDVSGLSSAKTYNVLLEKPSGIRYISETNTNIEVTLDNEVTKEIENILIEAINLDSNYKVVALDNSSSKTTVILKGTETVLNGIIDASTIRATIDLSGYTPGEYEIEVDVVGNDVRAIYTSKTTKVKVKIISK